MTFDEWWEGEEANEVAEGGDQQSLASAAWDAAVQAERQRCLEIIENHRGSGPAWENPPPALLQTWMEANEDIVNGITAEIEHGKGQPEQA